MSELKYKKAAQIIIKSGMLPFPITDTLLEIMNRLYNDEEIDFIIKAFKRKASQTLEELKKSSKMNEVDILRITGSLAKKGALFNQPSSSGIMIYRLLPLIMIGIFEYQFMSKLKYTEEEKKIAVLFNTLFDEVRKFVQDKYEFFLPVFRNIPPIDRTIPAYENFEGREITLEINKEIGAPLEKILPSQKLIQIINKFDDIAVGYCFCRQHKDLLGKSCKITDLRETCFTFGKSARFTTNYGFARKVSKEEALSIMKKSEEAGLIHKAFHPHGNTAKDETSICNCCKDCCATFELWKTGIIPMVNSTNYLSNIDQEICVGCGTCVERCPVDAIALNDNNKAERNEDWCIGCGICARFCPESAISLIEGQRIVSVLPPKLRAS
ncbi:MAG: 4Fe-4S binding protein [Promethearchaeota archaeon]